MANDNKGKNSDSLDSFVLEESTGEKKSSISGEKKHSSESNKLNDPILIFFSKKEKELGRILTERNRSLFVYQLNKDKKKTLEQVWSALYG